MAELGEKSGITAGETRLSPSWMDRLIQWIDGLPGPAWLFYALIWLPITLIVNVVLWIDGSVPFGKYGSIEVLFPPLVFSWLALYHYLTRVASASLQSYRPLLNADDAEFAQIDYEFTTLPRRLGWLTIPLALAFGISFLLSDPTILGGPAPNTVLPSVVGLMGGLFTSATLFGLLIRTFRQLRTVRKLHAQATNINLLKLEPAHAFAKLTASTAIGLILILFLGTAATSLGDPLESFTAVGIGSLVVLALFAAVIFVIPLTGMRDRLEDEKKRMVNETTDLLQMTSDILESKVRNRDYADLQGMETAIRALIRKGETFESIPTWPWTTGTIRGFASTLLLPIFLWVVTQLLGRFF
jgi:hypothetical protein